MEKKKTQTKKKTEKKNTSFKTKVKRVGKKVLDFLNSSISIIIVLVVLDLVMLMYIVGYTKGNGIRVGYYIDDEISINNIHFFINGSNNYFYSSGIAYTGEDVDVYHYIMGYYAVTKDGTYIPVLTRENTIESGMDLASLLELNNFSYSEAGNTKDVFTKDVLDNIDNLHFVFRATTAKDEESYKVNIDKTIELVKVMNSGE